MSRTHDPPRVQPRDEIRRIQTELGITTRFVIRYQEEVLAVADRGAVLRRGTIELSGAHFVALGRSGKTG